MTIGIKILVLVLCHLFGDYVLQSAFVANTKGENWYHLFVHCILYSIPFLICFGFCWQYVVITALHFPIDAAKAKYHKLSYVWDQILHYALLLIYLL